MIKKEGKNSNTIVQTYNPRVLVGNWHNERLIGGLSHATNNHPEYETSYKSCFKYVPLQREQTGSDQQGEQVRADEVVPAGKPTGLGGLIEKKQAQWKKDMEYLENRKTEYEESFLTARRPKPKPKALTEEELTKLEEQYQNEKAAAERNQCNRYGPRDFKPKEFPSNPRSFELQGKWVQFTPTGYLVEVKPPKPSASDYNTYLDACDKQEEASGSQSQQE